MPSERPKIVLVTRCFIVRDEDKRILMIRRADSDSHNPGLWECPGGKLDAGQDQSHALEREVAEETGLVVHPTTPLACIDSYVIGNGPYKGFPYVVIFGVAKQIGGKLKLSDEHSQARWLKCDELFDLELTPEVRKAVAVLKSQLE